MRNVNFVVFTLLLATALASCQQPGLLPNNERLDRLEAQIKEAEKVNEEIEYELKRSQKSSEIMVSISGLLKHCLEEQGAQDNENLRKEARQLADRIDAFLAERKK